MARTSDRTTPSGRTTRIAAVLLAALGLLTVFATTAAAHAGSPTLAPEPVATADRPEQPIGDLLEMVAPGGDPTRAVPQVAEGFFLQPLAAVGYPTSITFGPGDDGPDLYATVLPGEGTTDGKAFAGQVVRVHLDWTPAGPIAERVEPLIDGFQRPLGIAIDDAGTIYVSDRRPHPNADVNHSIGRVTELSASDTTQADGTVIVDGLPNGRHSTNHVRFASDGQTLLIPIGNPNDSGCNREDGTLQCRGGAADVFPITGAVIAVDVSEVSDAPATLELVSGGEPIDPYEVWDHPTNDDFRSKVTLVASGFRNIFDVTQAPASLPYGGHLYTAMNGADDPSSQDALFKLPTVDGADAGRNYTYPYCYNEGPAGGVGDDVQTVANPGFEGHPAAADCPSAPRAEALLGWHTCTTGLDFPREAAATGEVPNVSFPASFRSSVFVSECFHIFAPDWAERSSQDPGNATHSASHKVARVVLDDQGQATRVQDFVTGLAAPNDVQFGPDGAMYIADASGIHRVGPASSTSPDGPAGPTVDVQTAAFQFVPQVLVVPQGTTVAWHGNLLQHSVTTGDGQCANENLQPGPCDGNDLSNSDGDPDTFHRWLGPGETVTHTWESYGHHGYFCEPHDSLSMVGAVVVSPGL